MNRVCANVFFFVLSLSFSLFANAQAINTYYPNDFYTAVASGAKDDVLKNQIKAVLRSYHLQKDGQNDILGKTCDRAYGCMYHNPVSYLQARVFLMGQFYLHTEGGKTGVFDFYCNKVRDSSEFKTDLPGVDKIPDGTVVNTEHTWPQSKFTKKFPKDTQKADVHHLFPTDSKLNAIRGNGPFGEVVSDSQTLPCKGSGSRFGDNAEGREVFEPPTAHKGHVARAIFYFIMRYDTYMNPVEDQILRKWNTENPPDEEEIRRNDEIMELQGDRNPFVDFPELVDKIQKF